MVKQTSTLKDAQLVSSLLKVVLMEELNQLVLEFTTVPELSLMTRLSLTDLSSKLKASKIKLSLFKDSVL